MKNRLRQKHSVFLLEKENFAPIETQEDWDCSGWVVDTKNNKSSTQTEKSSSKKKKYRCRLMQSKQRRQ